MSDDWKELTKEQLQDIHRILNSDNGSRIELIRLKDRIEYVEITRRKGKYSR